MQEPITLKFKLVGGHEGVIPFGTQEELIINVRDGNANFHFLDNKITYRYAIQTSIKTALKAKYLERSQSTVVFYPGMNQKQIVDKISLDMKELQGKRMK